MLYAKIKSDLITALKLGDSYLVGILKLITTELSYAQVDYKQGDLPDEEVVKVLMKEAKKRKDSIETYTKVGAPDRAESERKELEIIEKYLPEMMSEADLKLEIAKIASDTGLTGGRLMGAVMGKLRGKVDGSLVQKVVNQEFAS